MIGGSERDIRNATLYGICLECGTPREMHRGEELSADGDKTIFWQRLITPCGHNQDGSDVESTGKERDS